MAEGKAIKPDKPTMNRKRRNLLLVFAGLLLLAGIPVWLVHREVEQERLDKALIAALRSSDTPAVLSLLQAGADPNTRDDPPRRADIKPPSFWQRLLAKITGKRRDLKESGEAVLTLAVMSDPGDHVIVDALLKRGANINARSYLGLTPFLSAVVMKDRNQAMYLLDRGADVNMADLDGQTPLMAVAVEGDVEMLTRLLNQGANVHAQDHNGRTAIHYALSGDTNAVTILQLLIERGANINTPDNDGDTPLFYAVTGDNIATIQLLLERGAKVNAKNGRGWSLLQQIQVSDSYFKHPNSQAIVHLLKQHGAK